MGVFVALLPTPEIVSYFNQHSKPPPGASHINVRIGSVKCEACVSAAKRSIESEPGYFAQLHLNRPRQSADGVVYYPFNVTSVEATKKIVDNVDDVGFGPV